VVEALSYKPEGRGIEKKFPKVSLEFFIDIIVPAALWPLGLTHPLTEMCKAKGKAIPLQALTGPEGSRRLRLPEFKTLDT
jgi:hypothetical protein